MGHPFDLAEIMSIDDALSAFSEALLSGEAKRVADHLDALSALADQLRDSQQHLRDSEGELRDSRADLRQSQDDLRQSQDDLRQSRADFRQGQDDLRQSQDDLRQSQDDAQAKGEEIQQLHRALESRDIIGQVKGMLMERYNIDAVAAFELLVKLSQKSNTRVEIIAQKLVELDHPGAEPNG